MMTTAKNVIRNLIDNEDGAALVEYGMLVSLIALICILAVKSVGTKISAVFQGINASL